MYHHKLKTMRGFTFLEVMVVLLIVGLLAVVFRPSSRPLIEGMRLRSSAFNIKSQILTAKTRAVANPKVHCGVYFDMVSTTHSSLLFFDNGSGSDYRYATGDGLYVAAQKLPKGISFQSYTSSHPDPNARAIVFRGDGSAKYNATIVIKNSYGKTKTIDVLASTGRIRMQ